MRSLQAKAAWAPTFTNTLSERTARLAEQQLSRRRPRRQDHGLQLRNSSAFNQQHCPGAAATASPGTASRLTTNNTFSDLRAAVALDARVQRAPSRCCATSSIDNIRQQVLSQQEEPRDLRRAAAPDHRHDDAQRAQRLLGSRLRDGDLACSGSRSSWRSESLRNNAQRASRSAPWRRSTSSRREVGSGQQRRGGDRRRGARSRRPRTGCAR